MSIWYYTKYTWFHIKGVSKGRGDAIALHFLAKAMFHISTLVFFNLKAFNKHLLCQNSDNHSEYYKMIRENYEEGRF